MKEENKRLSALVETLQRQLQEVSMNRYSRVHLDSIVFPLIFSFIRDSLQLAFADLVSNGESSFLAVLDPSCEQALQKYSDVVKG